MDFLQLVYAQFQDHLLTKTLRRLILPEYFYPNEGKIELYRQSIQLLDYMCKHSQQTSSEYYRSVYEWWSTALKAMLYAHRYEKVNDRWKLEEILLQRKSNDLER